MERLNNARMCIAKMMKSNKMNAVLKTNQKLFPALLVALLLLLLVETIWAGSVSPYLNTDYFSVIVVASGAIFVFTPKQETKETAGPELMIKRDYIFAMAAGVAGSIIIWYKIQNLSWLSYPISAISGALIVLLSILVLEEETERNESTDQ